VFGGNWEQMVNQLGSACGLVCCALMANMLPMLAPIVMSYLARRLGQGRR